MRFGLQTLRRLGLQQSLTQEAALAVGRRLGAGQDLHVPQVHFMVEDATNQRLQC